MSKYQPLWDYIQKQNQLEVLLSFQDIEKILGFPIDHSFLTYKKELLECGYCVKKISLKEQNVLIHQEH